MLGYSITQDIVASYQNYKYEDLYLLLKKQALYMYATSSLFHSCSYDARYQESYSILLDGSPNSLTTYIPTGTKIINVDNGFSSLVRIGGIDLLIPLCTNNVLLMSSTLFLADFLWSKREEWQEQAVCLSWSKSIHSSLLSDT